MTTSLIASLSAASARLPSIAILDLDFLPMHTRDANAAEVRERAGWIVTPFELPRQNVSVLEILAVGGKPHAQRYRRLPLSSSRRAPGRTLSAFGGKASRPLTDKEIVISLPVVQWGPLARQSRLSIRGQNRQPTPTFVFVA
jgi:hypothetical protein